jgi:hypothetical protein
MKKRFSEEQIIRFLKETDAGMPVVELCRKHGFFGCLVLQVESEVWRHGSL